MTIPVKKFLTQFKVVFGSLSTGRKISLLALICAVLLGGVLLVTLTGRSEYSVLYSDLEPEDAGAIIARLKEGKIPFQISGNGGSVLVPDQMVDETRLDLAAQGLPRGNAVGFELFDQTKLGMTEFAQNVNYQRAMQGELSRTINGFTEVESSRVHLVMQPKSLFVEDEKPATASVVLKLRPGKWLTRSQVDGIVHLVSSSIMGLAPQHVTVVDNDGKVLSGDRDAPGFKKNSVYQLEYQEKVERNLENRITTMLEKALGPEKAIVRVSSLINFKKKEQTEEMYFPDNQVVRSEQLYSATNDPDGKNPSGIPGLASQKAAEDAKTNNSEDPKVFRKQDRTVNYEIGKVTSHTVEPIGNMEKVSVAVIIDGNYELAADKEGVESWKYIPRSSEELDKIENIVKSAITFDKDRGDQVSVVNLPFQKDKLNSPDQVNGKVSWFDRLTQSVGPMMKYILMAVLALVVYLLVIRPVIQWVTSVEIPDAHLLQQLPKTVGELEREINPDANRLPFNDRATRLLSDNSDRVVQVLKEMVKQQ